MKKQIKPKKVLPKKEKKEIAVIEKKEVKLEIKKKEEITKELILNYAKTFLSGKLDENELEQFISIAQTFQLNPFKREIYCIPFGEGQYRKLSIITGYETYLKRAYRTLLISQWSTDIGKDEIGIYAKIIIKRKDWSGLFEHKVYMQEYNQSSNPLWKTKPYTMLKKVVTAQGFRLCFPEEFGGMPYTSDELPDEMTTEKKEIQKEAKINNVMEKVKDEIKVIKEENKEPEPTIDLNLEKLKKELLDSLLPYKEKLKTEDVSFLKRIYQDKTYTIEKHNQDKQLIEEMILKLKTKEN